ncbi:polysaccharide biosynthesis tyrosine autokinase [Microbacterium sp. 5K110]|uniref:polysaccharide biosynthesis tyrosine autokinase n=1 Tax=unclassified Microbacterium TaxID=2609290 RepID=UPI0014852544|nr:polysaccharide biosynthesis tyrosine autokinase [Microbacterium sp. 5K110]
MELGVYLRVFRAHWVAIVVATIVGGALAYGWAVLQPKTYTAEASGYVAATVGGSDAGSALIGENLAKAKVKSYIDLGSWRAVAQHAIDELGLKVTPEYLVNRVAVTNPLDTVNINVRAQASTPEGARDLAQAWLAGMAVEVQNLEGGSSGGGEVVRLVEGDSARLPSSPSYPNDRLFAALGVVAGLALGIIYAVARHTLDRRVRSAETVEKETGRAVVGILPLERTFSSASRLLPAGGSHVPHELFAMSEAMRELRTNIQFMDVDHPPRILVVTSPLPGDGKSTTSANLAVTLAASGQPVVLVDADLRRPMLANIFGIVADVGLTDVLARRSTWREVSQPAHTPNLTVLAAGRIPPNPSELVGSERMNLLLHELAAEAIVILDAPPLLPVTDAAVLSRQADGAIIVVTAGKTTYDLLKRALANIEKVGGRALGVVLNRVPKRGGGYYGGHYGREYYASAEVQAVSAVPAVTPAAGDNPADGQGLRRRSRRSA